MMEYVTELTGQSSSDDAAAAALTGGSGSMEGFPTRSDLAERYATRSGRDLSDLRFYCAMAGWKIAIIMEGSNFRFKQGDADDEMFAALDEGVSALAQCSLEIISGEVAV